MMQAVRPTPSCFAPSVLHRRAYTHFSLCTCKLQHHTTTPPTSQIPQRRPCASDSTPESTLPHQPTVTLVLRQTAELSEQKLIYMTRSMIRLLNHRLSAFTSVMGSLAYFCKDDILHLGYNLESITASSIPGAQWAASSGGVLHLFGGHTLP